MPKIAALLLALLSFALLPAVALAEEGPPPVTELTLSPEPLDFGKATVGTETAMVAVNVHNAGLVALPIDKVAIEGADSGDFKSNGSSCGWLEPGQDCTAWVAFMPGSTGAKTATLVVQPKEMPAVSSTLAGTGVSPQLAFTPGSYDFGIQRVNRGEGSTSLQLANVGEAMSQIGSIGIGGKNSATSGPATTTAGTAASCSRAKPATSRSTSTPGTRSPTRPNCRPTPTALPSPPSWPASAAARRWNPIRCRPSFGAVTVGATGPVQTVVFTNHGNLPGNFFIGIVAGGDAGSFRLLDESCSMAPLAPAADLRRPRPLHSPEQRPQAGPPRPLRR